MPTQSKRDQSGTKWTRHGNSWTAECLNCGAVGNTYSWAECRRGDAEEPFQSDMQPCHADDCTVMLCPDCDQFICAGCNLAHCKSHGVTLDDETFCPVCLAMVREDERADLELESQGGSRFASLCAEAGLTLDEMEAHGKVVN